MTAITYIEKFTRPLRNAQRIIEQNRSAIEMAKNASNRLTFNPVSALYENSPIGRMLAEVEHSNTRMRSLVALHELRHAGISDLPSDINGTFQNSQPIFAVIEARFTLPDVSAITKLMQDFTQSPIAGVMPQYVEQANKIQKAMEGMRSPWLDAQQAQDSVAGFARIQGIGGMLARMPPFADQVSDALRVDLGDWRDEITWPEPVLTDIDARAEFYVNLGFDPSLTDFPISAFQEMIEIAGLRREPPLLVNVDGEPMPRTDDDEDEQALVRNNRAHDELQRLEIILRGFIDALMKTAFGPDWPKHHLPNGLYDQWAKKREDAIKAGRRQEALVAYADFNDYERVICKGDNWRKVFVGHFIRVESVRESFQRLHPIRNDTMHARAINQDDELLLYVEVKRLRDAVNSVGS